jgi:hypothetical protein
VNAIADAQNSAVLGKLVMEILPVAARECGQRDCGSQLSWLKMGKRDAIYRDDL